MSQSTSRKARRMCKRVGHWPNTNNGSRFWCGNCGVSLSQRGAEFVVSPEAPEEPQP